MRNDEFTLLISKLKEKYFLNNISNLEIIFNHIINNYISKCRINDVKTKLYEILDELIDSIKYNEIISNQNDQQCCICLCNYKDNEITKALLCGHIFHQSCIDKCRSEKCPLCKNNVKNEIKGENEKNINIINNNNIEDSLNKSCFRKTLTELISILINISDNYLLQNNDIDYFEKLEYFLLEIKNDKLNLSIFKALFFVLFRTDSEPNLFENQLQYFDDKMGLEKYEIKKLNEDLYNHLYKIMDFVSIIKPNKDIMIELISYFEKVYKEYNRNANNKNNDYICIFTHIFNSKKILPQFFTYLFTYAIKYNKDKLNKTDLKDLFVNYKNLITIIFLNSSNPAYFTLQFEDNLEEDLNFMDYYYYFLEIVEIISELRESICKSNEQKKKFYENSCKLLKILYLSTKLNEDFLINKYFEKIFIKYYNFLKENKFIFCRYLITIQSKNNNEIYKKTILEICAEISLYISVELESNLFNQLFDEDNLIKNYIYKNQEIKDKKYINEDLNKYFKSLKYKINEKPLLLILINKLCEYIVKNQENNNNKVEKLKKEYFNTFIDIIKTNYDNWKKLEKENEELKIINNNLDIINSLILFNQNKIEKEIDKEKNDIVTRDSIKNIDLDENENQCPLKKNCLLIKNKSTKKAKPSILNDINLEPYICGNFSDINLNNIVLCLKRDILLKECSIYFSDIYFNDKNFIKLKKYFKFNFENNLKLICKNKVDKFNYPIKIKKYSNNNYAYPHLFVKPYTSFYNSETFRISHPYFHRESIRKPSFPYILPHYYFLKNFVDNYNEKIYFNEECEAIMKTNIICGNIYMNEQVIYFINNNEVKKECKKNIKYLFCSMVDDIKLENKIIIIKIKDIEEIISRRYIYDYRALEIFLKSGKSYYFNLYTKENLNSFFKEIEIIKKQNLKNNIIENDFPIIKNPIKYFEQNKYYEKWIDNEISTYQYLLYINKFSSRSYNDINQYPIFPWILLQSKSGSHKNKETLPKFRELEFPISIKKKEDIQDAILFFEASQEENPKYPSHYRLHYSTSGYLLTYLVRISPFTEEQIRFQNDQFDSPSRQINSIDEILSILSSGHDNRELVPEYFTTVEFLLNSNYVDFGCRLNDKIMINDIGYPEKFFVSMSQFIYYNRLLLNIKTYFEEINKPAFEEELKINLWIDLIFGCKQWDPKPKREKLNLFGKYCYRQNINFDKILEKYKTRKLKENMIIKKIDSKKSRIINFGQCPEVLFNHKHKENILAPPPEMKKDIDELEMLDNTQGIIEINKYEKSKKKKFKIVTFWLSKNKIHNYIYFLVYEDKNKNNERNIVDDTYYILIYKDKLANLIDPEYQINISEINLFNIKSKYNKNIYNNNIYSNLPLNKCSTEKIDLDLNTEDTELVITKTIKNERHASAMVNNSPEFNDYEKIETNNRKISDKNVINSLKKDYIVYDLYRISPKNILFDICFENEKKMYFFVGRNLDNSIKIYGIEMTKNNEGKLLFNIPTDSFVSCLHKKDDNIFFSGHKNGKLYEWKITYIEDKNKKNKKLIKKIEIVRDLMAHKESMICCINYIEKHNIIITASNDGKINIRKYYDFELLSVFYPKIKNSIISRIIYTDYDLLYLLIYHKDKKYQNKSSINVFTLNGLLIESSSPSNIIDIEPLKNGKIFCNKINDKKLNIFGLNQILGTFNDYDILSKIIIEKVDIKKCKITNFIFEQKKNTFYILLDNKILCRQQIPDFEFLFKGVDKLDYKTNRPSNNSSDNPNENQKNYSKKDIKRFGSL